ncbi:c-type cytochrome [Shimia marina]|uniref:Cytochrome c2 n=1 Tax=Shimia marina TaxID=321267 RepID=A0A0P1FBE2_9RHOB|nr:c-type cytochrome [Shimia marina]CUH51267.1 Cytochrome c2 [Shimia marina]SFD53548.1 WD-40 repeat-containing protein [Shimia marina]
MRYLGLLIALCLWPLEAVAEDFFQLKGHGGPIKGIAVSPDGSRILTASFDNALGLWVNRQPQWLEGHDAAVNAVAFVDEARAVSAGDDFAVRQWDLATGQSSVLGHHLGKVLSLAVSPDRQYVVSASWDSRLGVWSLTGAAPRFIQVGANVNDVAFAQQGRVLFVASADGRIRVFDFDRGTLEQLFLSNGFGVNTLVLNEAAGWLAFGAVDGVTKIVSLDSAEVIKDITLERRPVLAMDMSRDGGMLAVGDGEGYILLLNRVDWSIASDIKATHRGPIWALAFAADGQNIHAGGLDDAMFSWPLSDPRDAPRMVAEDRDFLNGNDRASNGERQFQRKCSICHTLTGDSARRAGPTLKDLFGRPAGTVPDYTYSKTLQDAEIVWNGQTIDALFDLGPDVYIAGSKMPVQRIARAEDRADLIAYLRLYSDIEDQ